MSKKLLSLILAAIFAASALASCAASEAGTINASIRVTSSDAEDAAAWLDARLGDAIPGRVVIGTDADGFGVDISALEDDGYVIRAAGSDTVLFARTEAGLDRAVREYAKAVEAGSPVADVTYHEGARVKRIEIAGRDVAEYTIYVPDDERVIAAANTLASDVERACGVKIPVAVGEAAAPYISLGYVHDESLGTVGYTWDVGEDGLTLGFSDKYAQTSPAVGVKRYLEKALDWFGLSYGYEDLPAADLVSINAGESGSDACDFDYIAFYGDVSSAPDRIPNSNPSYYNIVHACHGILANKIAGDLSNSPDKPWMYDEPCWLSEDFYEYSLQDLTDYIEAKIDAGYVPGDTLRFIDVAQSDNAGWCTCKACSKMYKDEGFTHAGEVLTWANRVSEELNKTYPGIYYGVFAYWDTKKPAKTIVPNDLLYITYCFDCNCSLHVLDGSECKTGEPKQGTQYRKDHDNATVCSYFEEWEKLTPRIYAWYYGIGNGLLSVDYIHTVRDNLRYLYDHGVKGLFWEAEDEGYNTTKAARILSYYYAWDVDMSDEEYDALYERTLRTLYGDGVGYIKDFIDEETRIYLNTNCATCWGWDNVHASVNPVMWKDEYDLLFDLVEHALPLACDKLQERRLTKLSCSCIYKCSLSSYFDAYDAYDDERCEELCRRYALIYGRLLGIGIDMTAIRPFAGKDAVMYERDLLTMAWKNDWLENAEVIGMKIPTRPAPDLEG